MGFNELNSVEHYIIHQLSGPNLNNKEMPWTKRTYGAKLVYRPTDQIRRIVQWGFRPESASEALIRLNPNERTEAIKSVIW